MDVRTIAARSPVGFEFRRRRYNSTLQPAAASGPDPLLATEVTERGVCVIDRYLDEEQLATLRQETLASDRDPGARGNVFHELDPTADGMPTLHQLRSSVFLRETMDAIAGSPTRLYATKLQIRDPQSSVPELDLWHTDTWRVRLKAMLFLDDVTPDAGPMIYVAGSHRRSIRHPSRWLYGYLRDALPAPWHRLADRAARNGEHVTCTGPAGTLIVFDTRGFHTATAPTAASRRTLTFSFALASDLTS